MLDRDHVRVTDVLKPFTGYEFVNHTVLANAAVRGTAVHSLCAAIAQDAFVDDENIQEDLRGFVKSFRLWKEAQVSSFVLIEKRYFDDDNGYTGQLDYVILGTDDKLYLVDLKTGSSPQKTHPVQMAAYDELLRKHSIAVHGAMLVYLDREGAFPDVKLLEDMTNERSVFLSALHCYKYFNRKRKR